MLLASLPPPPPMLLPNTLPVAEPVRARCMGSWLGSSSANAADDPSAVGRCWSPCPAEARNCLLGEARLLPGCCCLVDGLPKAAAPTSMLCSLCVWGGGGRRQGVLGRNVDSSTHSTLKRQRSAPCWLSVHWPRATCMYVLAVVADQHSTAGQHRSRTQQKHSKIQPGDLACVWRAQST